MNSILLGILGAVARFHAAPEVAGFKMHALGVSLIVLAALGVIVSLKPLATHRLTRTSPSPSLRQL